MVKIFISGLRPGNKILKKPERRGTRVVVRDDDEEATLLDAVSDTAGNVESEIPDFEGTKNITVRIHDIGFLPISFSRPIGRDGLYYPAKMMKDLNIDRTLIEQDFDDIAEWENWNSEARFGAALDEVLRRMRPSGPTLHQSAQGPQVVNIGTAEERDTALPIRPFGGASPLDLSFDPNNKIITINESGEIEFRRLYGAIMNWLDSPAGMVESDIVEVSGNIELPDGSRTPSYMIVKGGWRLSAIDSVLIMGCDATGRDEDGKAYHPVVEEARNRVRFLQEMPKIEGGGALQAGDSEVSGSGHVETSDGDQDGDVTIEVPTGGITITGFPPTVQVNEPTVPISNVAQEHTASLQRLEELRKQLDGVHGADAPETPGIRNTQEVPLSEEAIETARKVVDAAIDLQRAPTVSRPIIDALESIRQHIEKFGEVVKETGKTAGKFGEVADKLKGLAFALAGAAGAMALFIEKVMTLLGG